MAYRFTPKLNFPIGNLKNITLPFKSTSVYDGEYWGTHLGVDIDAKEETKVFAIGRGVVVYSKLHPGEISEDGKTIRRNWGGIMIIAHKDPRSKKKFYSLYGHLGKRYLKKGDVVEMGDVLGTIGKSMSESNGAWEEEHLHFAIYAGPFHGKVLPGYHRKTEDVTQLEYWIDPLSFIKNYSSGQHIT